jgi:hypothetical protein
VASVRRHEATIVRQGNEIVSLRNIVDTLLRRVVALEGGGKPGGQPGGQPSAAGDNGHSSARGGDFAGGNFASGNRAGAGEYSSAGGRRAPIMAGQVELALPSPQQQQQQQQQQQARPSGQVPQASSSTMPSPRTARGRSPGRPRGQSPSAARTASSGHGPAFGTSAARNLSPAPQHSPRDSFKQQPQSPRDSFKQQPQSPRAHHVRGGNGDLEWGSPLRQEDSGRRQHGQATYQSHQQHQGARENPGAQQNQAREKQVQPPVQPQIQFRSATQMPAAGEQTGPVDHSVVVAGRVRPATLQERSLDAGAAYGDHVHIENSTQIVLKWVMMGLFFKF